MPTIIGIEGLLDRLHDGDLVELDADRGIVTPLQQASGAPRHAVASAREARLPNMIGAKARVRGSIIGGQASIGEGATLEGLCVVGDNETVAAALTKGRPVVVAFATPAFCQTQFCGPVVENVLVPAWKQYGASRWALRVNPSSGNLHPTEAWIVRGPRR